MSETMILFSPIRALTSDDLPAFGLPRMQICWRPLVGLWAPGLNFWVFNSLTMRCSRSLTPVL